jgi:hypothetical protein
LVRAAVTPLLMLGFCAVGRVGAQSAAQPAALTAPGARSATELPDCVRWWAARRAAVVGESDRPVAKALEGRSVRELRGAPTSPRPFADRIAVARRTGSEGAAALIALGVAAEPAAVALCEAVLRDDLVGRRVAGESPVPPVKRAAAAIALGCARSPRAFEALREFRAAAGALDAELDAATALALALADEPEDDRAFRAYLASGTGAPAGREAVAAALLMRGRRSSGPRADDARWLAVEPGGAGRGVAAAAFFRADAADSDRLAAAALGSPDAVVRALALLALAARGDARADEAAAAMAALGPIERGYGVVAWALRARATGDLRAKASFVAAAAESPQAALVGEELLAPRRRGARRATDDAPRLSAAHAGLFGAPATAALCASLDPTTED